MKYILSIIIVFILLIPLVEAEELPIDRVLVFGDTTLIIDPEYSIEQTVLEQFASELISHYEELGYYYASINLRDITKSADSLVLHWELIKGPLLKLREIKYTGLKRTKLALIDKFINSSELELITSKNLENLASTAAEIGFLDFLPPLEIVPTPGFGSADLILNFKEKKDFRFEGGAGYIDDDQGSFVWYLNLQLNNLLGGGRDLRLLSDHREKRRQILELNLRLPLFLISQDNLSFELKTRDYRDLFYEFSTLAVFESKISSQSNLSFDLGWLNVEPDGPLVSYNVFSSGVSFVTGRLYPKEMPQQGLKFELGVNYRYRRYTNDTSYAELSGTSFNDSRIKLKSDAYLRFSSRFVNYFSLLYTGLETTEVNPPLSEMFFVGGPGTLRGFRNEQFSAIKFAVLTYEPQIHFGSGYLFGFTSSAYLRDQTKDEFYRFGYGLGMALAGENSRIKLSLGWNKDLSIDQPSLSVEFLSSI